MKIPLSNRLLACCGYIQPGARVADIGCDHGYLGIHLLKTGIARSIIAADVNEGPLQSAMRNAMKFGVRDKMTFILSDGLRNVPRDFDTVVCAGMGADTMISILQAAPWLQDCRYRLILQCQSKTPTLRRYLSDNGWHIAEESVLRDGKFLYTIMAVAWQPEHSRLTVGQWYLPPALLESKSRELPAYYKWVVDGLKIASEHRHNPETEQALRELTENPTLDFLKEETK